MLGSTPMASVVAAQDSAVHVVDQASAIVQKRPELTYAIDRPSSAISGLSRSTQEFARTGCSSRRTPTHDTD